MPLAVAAFCAQRVFELSQERGVRDLEVSFAAIEVGGWVGRALLVARTGSVHARNPPSASIAH